MGPIEAIDTPLKVIRMNNHDKDVIDGAYKSKMTTTLPLVVRALSLE